MVVLSLARAHLSWRLLWLMLLLLVPFSGFAAADEFAALQIKAAFLHKFPDYVQKPGTAFEQREQTLVFGVAGSPQVFGFLTQLVAAQGATMRAAEVRNVASPGDLDGVHVLFVGVGTNTDTADLLLRQALAGSTLTVTDLPGPQPPGSMIHFFIEGDRVRFDIALEPAQAAGLRLSSRLLQIARQVSGNLQP